MALIVKLAEFGNPATGGRDKITLKAEIESPLIIRRNPTIIPLAGGEIVGIDLGKNVASIVISGVVDYELTELFVNNIAGGPFQAGEVLTGTVGWNALTTPVRSATPAAVVVAGKPNLTAPTSLIISGVTPESEFFVDNEEITGTDSSATADVNEPFPTKRRLEHVARFWYANGKMTLTTRSGAYTVFIKSIDLTMRAGLEDRYNFKIAFVEAVQGLSSPV